MSVIEKNGGTFFIFFGFGFRGWRSASPSRKDKTKVVIKVISRERIPIFYQELQSIVQFRFVCQIPYAFLAACEILPAYSTFVWVIISSFRQIRAQYKWSVW